MKELEIIELQEIALEEIISFVKTENSPCITITGELNARTIKVCKSCCR